MLNKGRSCFILFKKIDKQEHCYTSQLVDRLHKSVLAIAFTLIAKYWLIPGTDSSISSESN